MQEEWRDIVIEKNGITYDYTGLYQVSNLGRVKKLANSRSCKEKILNLAQNNKGYTKVTLSKNGKQKQYQLHRLVATAFIPNPNNWPVVNHKDENPCNNCSDNLEWCSYQYNTRYSLEKHYEERIEKIRKPRANFCGENNPMHRSKCKHNCKKVICLETCQVFNSIKDADDWCNGGIKHALSGNQKTAGKHPETGEKLHWMYYEDWLKLQENQRKDDV